MYPIARINAYLLLQLMLTLIPLQGVLANDATSLKAVLFYPAFCEECPAVIDDFLFPLTASQGERLELYPVDITEPPGDEIFKQVLQRFGAKPDAWDKPALLTGGLLLRGKAEITDGLPPLLAGDLASELTTWPDLPGLQALISGEESDGTQAPGSASDQIAAALAWAVMAGMLLSLGFSASRLVKQGRSLLDASGLRSWSLPVFALLGLGIGVYLSSVALTHNQAMCGPIGDCMSVQASPYAKLFDIPMSMWGVVFYLGILLLWFSQRVLTGVWGQRSMLGLIVFSLFGVIFSVYLTSLELFVIHAVCIWCLTSAVLATLIMLTVMLKTTGAEPCTTG
ncbi:MAG: vitamin K epoxide reductase family protein [Pseudomonadota bacterium]